MTETDERRDGWPTRDTLTPLLAERDLFVDRPARRRARLRGGWSVAVLAIALIVGSALLVGLAFAGSPERIAAGVRIAGVRVGGLTPAEARARLEERWREAERRPTTFVAAGARWQISPRRLGVRVDWAGAVEAARREGNGLGPFRGLRRIGVRVFGADVVPAAGASEAALRFQIDRIATVVGRPHRESAIVLRGLRPRVVEGRPGRALARRAAARTTVRALASLVRGPVVLPVRVTRPRVSAAALRPALRRTRLALSAPVRLRFGRAQYRLPRWRMAKLLSLPANGSTSVDVAGPAAQRYVRALGRALDQAPRDAGWSVSGSTVRLVPDAPGRRVDSLGTRRALLRAALSPTRRTARIAVTPVSAKRTTAEARAMGIRGLVGSYETIYGGVPNRIHNVQLVSRLIDGHLIRPGETFSFNGTTGERTAEKGFLEAPVIINGELQNGLGGGVCQVSTTVFNAAYEAGLRITSRTNHALYISHYPLGRDATVNYPDLDLRFVNDTPHWLLLRTFVGPSSLRVSLYGTPVHRRIESETSPLVTTSGPTTRRVSDPTLTRGTTVVEDYGEPSRSTQVRRRVFTRSGRLLHDDTWRSWYRSEPRIVRVGTKPTPEPPKRKPPEGKKPGEPEKPPPGDEARRSEP